MHTSWRAKAGPPRDTYTSRHKDTQIRQTLSLREKMDLSAEEAMLRRLREREREFVRLIPSQPCLSTPTLVISHTHTYTGRIYSVILPQSLFSRGKFKASYFLYDVSLANYKYNIGQ